MHFPIIYSLLLSHCYILSSIFSLQFSPFLFLFFPQLSHSTFLVHFLGQIHLLLSNPTFPLHFLIPFSYYNICLYIINIFLSLLSGFNYLLLSVITFSLNFHSLLYLYFLSLSLRLLSHTTFSRSTFFQTFSLHLLPPLCHSISHSTFSLHLLSPL